MAGEGSTGETGDGFESSSGACCVDTPGLVTMAFAFFRIVAVYGKLRFAESSWPMPGAFSALQQGCGSSHNATQRAP